MADLHWGRRAKTFDDAGKMLESHYGGNLKWATARGKREFQAQIQEEAKFLPPGEL
jgi:hypothetical protein